MHDNDLSDFAENVNPSSPQQRPGLQQHVPELGREQTHAEALRRQHCPRPRSQLSRQQEAEARATEQHSALWPATIVSVHRQNLATHICRHVQ